MLKLLFATFCMVLIVFFLWNILKRLFLTSFYNDQVNRRPQKNRAQQNESEVKNSKGLNWDAETVDYEEVEEPQKRNT